MYKSFRDEFKLFKGKDYDNINRVINFNRINEFDCPFKNNVVSVKCPKSNTNWKEDFGMKDPSEWEVYSFLNKPGLLFIKNPFYTWGQRYWIIRCLEYYTRRPSKLNIDSHTPLGSNENWWEFCHRENNVSKDFIKKLRWATFGYHHNWDTKEYSEHSKCEFPSDLKILCSFLAQEMGFSEFDAQAAIINLYHFGCTLSGHTDHSEMNVQAPLFSFSFGQSAIFLIGGTSKEDEALPVLLESGDVIVMSDQSRLCYHGVPKIFPSEKQPWNRHEKQFCDKSGSKYYHKEVTEKLWSDAVWEPFEEYITEARINMNVRQVLLPGQKVLHS